MKWYHTKYNTKCTHCKDPILKDELNYASSTAVFCETCGKLKEDGQLVYSKKQQIYIIISDTIDEY